MEASTVQLAAVTKVEAWLRSLNAQYKIILPTGEEYGELQAAVDLPKKRQYRFTRGTLSGYVSPHLRALETGGTVRIPVSPEIPEVKELHSVVGKWCTYHWGAEKFLVVSDFKKGCVEVLRVD